MKRFLFICFILIGLTAHGQRFVKYVDTMASLRALNPNDVHTTVELLGYYTKNDGGGGTFFYDSASAVTDDGGGYVKPTSFNGRWTRIVLDNTVDPRGWGAKGDGTTVDTTAIRNAYLYVAPSKGVVQFGAGTYIATIPVDTAFVTLRGISQQGAKNAGEGATIIKMPPGSSTGAVITATVECSIENIQVDGNKDNVTGTIRGIWFNADNVFKESLIRDVTVVNCIGDGIYLDAHEIKLQNVSSLKNGGRGLYIDNCYDVMLDHVLCGWNIGNGFESTAAGATLRIQQLDTYYNQGSGAVFHSPFWAFVSRLQADYNFKDGVEIDVSTTSVYIDILYPLIYGSNVDQDNFGNLNSAASGTYSDVRISGTQYPKNIRILGNKIGLNTASTKKPQYHITWSNSQPGVGFGLTLQDIDVDTSSGVTTTTGKSTPDTFLTSSSWVGRLLNHRDGTNVRTITKNSFMYHTTDGSQTPIFTVFNDYNLFVKSNILAYGYVTAGGAVYSSRDFTATKAGLQVKSDTGEAFGISSVGDSTYLGSDSDSTPLLRMNGPAGEWTATTTLTNLNGTTKAFGVDYVINQTSGTGSSIGVSVNTTETAKGSGSHRLLQLATGGTPRFYVQTDGRPIVVSPNGTAGMLLRGDGSTDSQILFNYAATLDRRLTLAGNSINVTDAAGSAANGLSLQPSGGTVTLGGALTFGSGGPIQTSGSGSPEGSITAGVGSVYLRTGGGASTTLYVKESGSGNIGWVAYGAAGSGGVTDGDKGDITVSSSGTVWTIDNTAVTYAKMQNVSAASKLLGRGSAAGSGSPQEITIGAGLTMSGTTLTASGATVADSDYGDITVTGSGTSWTIDNSAVTYAKIQDMNDTRMLGRKTANGTGPPEEITVSDALDWASGSTPAFGDVLYRNASSWYRLAPGTSGQFLQTQGVGSSPQWATPTVAGSALTGSSLASGITSSSLTSFGTSPTLITPTIGVATATSINKVAITAPASSATLTIANGKTLTVNNTVTLAGTDSTTYTLPDISADIGFRNVPQNSQSAAYTLVLADSGKHVFHPSSDANSRTFTIPANGTVAFPVGTTISFYNASANSCTIAITTDTLRKAGTGTTGSVTLPQYALATIMKVTTTEWVISGNGI